MKTRRIRRSRINENQKVTLTLGQLKRLFKESISDEGDFEIEDGILVKYHGKGGDVEIPHSVRYIGQQAFDRCSGLTSVTIPYTVRSIGRMAFYGCSGLTSVTIPDSVTTIDVSAFRECINLESVTIPNSVKSIYELAFVGTKLKSVIIPDSVVYIGAGAFCQCSELTSVSIGDGVTNIGEHAFSHCSKLKTIYVSDEEQKDMILDGKNILPRTTRIIVDGEDSDDDYEVTEHGSGTIFINNRIDELKDELNAEFGG